MFDYHPKHKRRFCCWNGMNEKKKKKNEGSFLAVEIGSICSLAAKREGHARKSIDEISILLISHSVVNSIETNSRLQMLK